MKETPAEIGWKLLLIVCFFALWVYSTPILTAWVLELPTGRFTFNFQGSCSYIGSCDKQSRWTMAVVIPCIFESLPLSMLITQTLFWLLPPTRRVMGLAIAMLAPPHVSAVTELSLAAMGKARDAFERQGQRDPDYSFRRSTIVLLKVLGITSAILMPIALVASFFLVRRP